MRLGCVLVFVGALIGVNTFLFLGWGAIRPLEELLPHGHGQHDAAGWMLDGHRAHAAAGGAAPAAAAASGHASAGRHVIAEPARLRAGGPGGRAAAPQWSQALAAAQQQLARGPHTELLCADRPREDEACHVWRCHRDYEVRWVWCKATCGTCDLLRRAIANDTGLPVRVVPRLSGCADASPDCSTVATPSRCVEDQEGMLKDCQASCGFCGKQAPAPGGAAGAGAGANDTAEAWRPPLCADDLSLCPLFRQRGLCNTTSWLATQCRLSCGRCTPEPRSALNASASLIPLGKLRGIQQPSECKDYHEQCGAWAKAGHCRGNPSFMNLNCRAACHACAPPAPPAQPWRRPPPPPQFGRFPGAMLPQDPRRLPGGALPRFQLPGAAQLPGGFPRLGALNPPPPPGAAYDPRAGAPGSAPAAPEPPADEWQPYWLCGSAQVGGEAGKECTKLEESEIAPCKDNLPDCEKWADADECEKNPGFMGSVCKEACSMCTVYNIPNPYEFVYLGEAANSTAEWRIRRRQEAAEDPDSKDGDDEEDEADDPQLVLMPAIGFGTAGLGAETPAKVAAAVNTGYTMIDTAEARDWYREDLVPLGLRQASRKREGVFIISKLHPRDHGANASRAAFERALRDLDTDYVDLWLIHYPRCFAGAGCKEGSAAGTWQDSWRVMEELHNLGKARMLGVSNFNQSELDALLDFAEIKPAVLQAHADPLDSNTQLLNFCLERGVVFQAYSVLGTQWVARPGEPNPVLGHPVIKRVANEVSRTPAQVVLRWALQRGMAVLPRSSNPAHMEENLQVFDFDLDADQMAAINALDGTRHRDAGPGAGAGAASAQQH